MKFAIMSDIHCNIVTFEKLVQDAINNGITNFLFLGDFVTDGYHGNEVINLIKKLKGTYVLGNREKYIKSIQNNGYNINSLLNFNAICYDSLSNFSLEFINKLKEVEIIKVLGVKILLIHGDEFDYENKNITIYYDKLINEYDFDICLLGHTHIQKMDIYKEKMFINPGSVGQPLDSKGFSYCILELNNNSKPLVTYRQIEVSLEILNEIRKDFIDSKFYYYNPEWCELIIASISNSFNYIKLFMDFIYNDIIKCKNLTQKKYNEILKRKYKDFIKEYNLYN